MTRKKIFFLYLLMALSGSVHASFWQKLQTTGSSAAQGLWGAAQTVASGAAEQIGRLRSPASSPELPSTPTSPAQRPPAARSTADLSAIEPVSVHADYLKTLYSVQAPEPYINYTTLNKYGVTGTTGIDYLTAIKAGGMYLHHLLNNNAAMIPHENPEQYLTSIISVMWYLYCQACNKHQEHDEGTFVLHGKLGEVVYSFLRTYVDNFSTTWQDRVPAAVVTDKVWLASNGKATTDEAFRAYNMFVLKGRNSSHFNHTKSFADQDFMHYGIDIRFKPSEKPSSALLPANKRHILFGKTRTLNGDIATFIKLENAGIYDVTSSLQHGLEFIESQVGKRITSGYYEQPSWRKERVPDSFIKFFTDIKNQSSLDWSQQDQENLTIFGLQKTFNTIGALQHTHQTQEGIAGLYRAYLQLLSGVFDYAYCRFGKEVILTQEELFHLQLFAPGLTQANQETIKEANKLYINTQQTIQQLLIAQADHTLIPQEIKDRYLNGRQQQSVAEATRNLSRYSTELQGLVLGNNQFFTDFQQQLAQLTSTRVPAADTLEFNPGLLSPAGIAMSKDLAAINEHMRNIFTQFKEGFDAQKNQLQLPSTDKGKVIVERSQACDEYQGIGRYQLLRNIAPNLFQEIASYFSDLCASINRASLNPVNSPIIESLKRGYLSFEAALVDSISRDDTFCVTAYNTTNQINEQKTQGDERACEYFVEEFSKLSQVVIPERALITESTSGLLLRACGLSKAEAREQIMRQTYSIIYRLIHTESEASGALATELEQ